MFILLFVISGEGTTDQHVTSPKELACRNRFDLFAPYRMWQIYTYIFDSGENSRMRRVVLTAITLIDLLRHKTPKNPKTMRPCPPKQPVGYTLLSIVRRLGHDFPEFPHRMASLYPLSTNMDLEVRYKQLGDRIAPEIEERSSTQRGIN